MAMGQSESWRDDLGNSDVIILLLHDFFYQSDGADTLDEAVRLNKPVLLIQVAGRRTPVPQAFSDYQGRKATVTMARKGLDEKTDKFIQAILRRWGINEPPDIIDYGWRKR